MSMPVEEKAKGGEIPVLSMPSRRKRREKLKRKRRWTAGAFDGLYPP